MATDYKNQVLDRTNQHVKDVVPTQADRETEVAMRKAERTDQELILEKKVMTYKTSTPSGDAY